MKILNRSGFSLIEVVVAMAVLIIVVIGFSALFTNSFLTVFSAGHKSEAQFTAQDKTENALMGYIDTGATESNYDFTLNFEGTNISVPGKEIMVNVDYVDSYGNNLTTTVTTFRSDNN